MSFADITELQWYKGHPTIANGETYNPGICLETHRCNPVIMLLNSTLKKVMTRL